METAKKKKKKKRKIQWLPGVWKETVGQIGRSQRLCRAIILPCMEL